MNFPSPGLCLGVAALAIACAPPQAAAGNGKPATKAAVGGWTTVAVQKPDGAGVGVSYRFEGEPSAGRPVVSSCVSMASRTLRRARPGRPKAGSPSAAGACLHRPAGGPDDQRHA